MGLLSTAHPPPLGFRLSRQEQGHRLPPGLLPAVSLSPRTDPHLMVGFAHPWEPWGGTEGSRRKGRHSHPGGGVGNPDTPYPFPTWTPRAQAADSRLQALPLRGGRASTPRYAGPGHRQPLLPRCAQRADRVCLGCRVLLLLAGVPCSLLTIPEKKRNERPLFPIPILREKYQAKGFTCISVSNLHCGCCQYDLLLLPCLFLFSIHSAHISSAPLCAWACVCYWEKDKFLCSTLSNCC